MTREWTSYIYPRFHLTASNKDTVSASRQCRLPSLTAKEDVRFIIALYLRGHRFLWHLYTDLKMSTQRIFVTDIFLLDFKLYINCINIKQCKTVDQRIITRQQKVCTVVIFHFHIFYSNSIMAQLYLDGQHSPCWPSRLSSQDVDCSSFF